MKSEPSLTSSEEVVILFNSPEILKSGLSLLNKFKIVFPSYFKPEANKVKLNYSGAEIQAITVAQVVEAIKECRPN